VIPAPSYGIGDRTPRWNRKDLDNMMIPSLASDIDSRVAEIVASIKDRKQRRPYTDSDERRAVRARWGVDAASKGKKFKEDGG